MGVLGYAAPLHLLLCLRGHAKKNMNMNQGLVSRIFRNLQDVFSRDLVERPVIPFGGPGAAVKCDESKFNHKAKVNL